MSMWVHIDDAAAILGINRKTVERRIAHGMLNSKLDEKRRRVVEVQDRTLQRTKEQARAVLSTSRQHGDFLHQWARAAEAGAVRNGVVYSSGTTRAYCRILERYFKQYATLSTSNIRKAMVEICGGAGAKSRLLKAINTYLIYLRDFEPDVIDDPSVYEEIPRLKSGYRVMKERRVVYDSEFRRVYFYIKTHPFYAQNPQYSLFLRAVVAFLWFTGARREGACRIQVSDVCWEDPMTGFPTVTLTEKGKGGVKKVRKAPMPRRLGIILKAWLERREEPWREFVFYNPISGFDLANDFNSLSKLMAKISSGCGVPFSTHSWRYGYASELDRRGATTTAIAAVMGHSRVSTTQEIYIRRNRDNAMREVWGLLNR